MKFKYIALLSLVASAACAPAGPPAGEPVAPETETVGPLDGTNYALAYVDDTGLRWRNTLRAVDTLLDAGAVLRRSVAAPTGSAAAVEYQVGATVRVVVVSAGSPAMVVAHEGTTAGTYTMAWSPDGQLGVGYQPGAGETGAVVGVGADGAVWNFGCSASNRFHAWGSNGSAVVGDSRNVYRVNVRGCGTLSTLPRQGKSDFAYAPNGERVAFMMQGQRGGLYIARTNGSGATIIADQAFQPRNVHWAPDASRVAFEIRSRNYANVTHVAVHDVASGQIRFFDQETELGTPIDNNVCWSADSRYLIHERTYYRTGATADYVQRQLVQKTVATNSDRVVFEELISTGRGPDSFECWWAGGQHFVILTQDSWDLVNVTSSEAFEVNDERRLLFIRPVVQ